jgi:cytochrome c-type protein NapB
MNKSFKSKLSVSILICVICVVCISILGAQKLFVHRNLSAVQPGMNQYTEQMPGESFSLDRPYEGAPPLVPHSVEDLTPARGDNQCFECHFEGIKLDEGHTATKIPASHFTNEYSGDTQEDHVIGIRYNCLQCHVPQTK